MTGGAVYRRVLLKVSGEALGGEAGFGLDPGMLAHVTRQVSGARDLGVEVAIVVGGGNFLRGVTLSAAGFDRVTGDRMGMLATLLNALALAASFTRAGFGAVAMSAVEASGAIDPYRREAADRALTGGQVVVLAGGTGNPFFSTDSAAALRAAELGAQALLKATKVDGVYDRDPVRDPTATRFDALTYQAVIERSLGVMDLTAVTLCRENSIPIVVFDLFADGALSAVLEGQAVGTTIGPSMKVS
jgi:uridylate kinase